MQWIRTTWKHNQVLPICNYFHMNYKGYHKIHTLYIKQFHIRGLMQGNFVSPWYRTFPLVFLACHYQLMWITLKCFQIESIFENLHGYMYTTIIAHNSWWMTRLKNKFHFSLHSTKLNYFICTLPKYVWFIPTVSFRIMAKLLLLIMLQLSKEFPYTI